MRYILYMAALMFSFACRRRGEPQKPVTPASIAIETKVDTVKVYRFEEFPTKLYKGKIAKVDVDNHPIAKNYRITVFSPPTTTRELAFAGHFAVAKFQHTLEKTGGLIVDLKNGEVYELPNYALGYSYKKDSRLLIVNPPRKDGKINTCRNCGTVYWLWDDSTRQFHRL